MSWGYEEKLEEIAELQNRINNPEPTRLLTEQRRLNYELECLMDGKIILYQRIKEIVKEGWQLIQIEKDGFICFFKGNYSQAGHPHMHYFFEGSSFPTGPIPTFSGVDFKNLTPKEFMDKLINGIGFMPRNL